MKAERYPITYTNDGYININIIYALIRKNPIPITFDSLYHKDQNSMYSGMVSEEETYLWPLRYYDNIPIEEFFIKWSQLPVDIDRFTPNNHEIIKNIIVIIDRLGTETLDETLFYKESYHIISDCSHQTFGAYSQIKSILPYISYPEHKDFLIEL